MFRPLAAALLIALAGCQCGSPVEADAGVDGGKDAGKPPDAGADAGLDGCPVCSAELCDGIDNDCDGTVDLSPDGGALTQLCPLQLGTCKSVFDGGQGFRPYGAYVCPL